MLCAKNILFDLINLARPVTCWIVAQFLAYKPVNFA